MESTTAAERRVHPRVLLAVLVLALAVRVAFAVTFLRHPVSDIIPQDMMAYTKLGRAIAAGALGDPLFQYVNAPYGFVVAPFTWLPASAATWAVAALQIVLDLLSVVLVARIAGRAYGPRAGVAAALFYALYGAAIHYTAIVLPVTLSIVALLTAIEALIVCRERAPKASLVAGAALGALILIRPNALPLLAVAAVWLAAAGWRRAAWMAAGTALVFAPFVTRSVAAGHGLSPFPVNGGINFYIGNNPEATGTYGHVENVDDRPVEQVVTSVAEAARRAGRPLDESAASRFWFDEALHWMRRDPAAAVRLTLWKAAWLLRTEEVSLNASYPLARDHMAILRPTVTFGLIVPFALWGAAAALWARETRSDPNVRLILAITMVFAASVVAFFISDRYRIPLAGPLAVLAGHGAVTLYDDMRRRRPARAAAGVAVAALGAFGSLADLAPFRYDEPMPRFSLAAAYFERGRVDEGLAECEAGLAIASDLPQGYHCRAAAYLLKNEPFVAEKNLRAAIERIGFFKMSVRAELAALYERQGLYEDALRVTDDEEQRAHLQAAYDEQQSKTPDRHALADAEQAAAERAFAERRWADARYAWKRAVQAEPKRAAAWLGLARAAGELALVEEGCEAASQAVWLAAHDAEARAAQQQLCGRR